MGLLGTSFVRQLFLVMAAIGGTTLFVWNKVQFEDVARRTSEAEQRIERLMEDQSMLRARVMQKSTPGLIRSIAEDKLMMKRSSSQRVLTLSTRHQGEGDG